MPPGPPQAYEVVQLLALAHAIERATEDGLATRRQIGRVLGFTQARVSQICKLAFLAPDIQGELIAMAPFKRVTERGLRKVVAETEWGRQRETWRRMIEA